MDRMKIAIIGSRGYLGKEIITKLKEIEFSLIEINRVKGSDFFLDLASPNDFDFKVFEMFDYLIMTAAVSNPNACEKSYKEAYNINVSGTKTVIEQALNHQCRVLFLSSDAVYGSDIDKIFNENCYTKPKTAYGKMKKEIEDIFKDNQLFKSIRLSYVISHNDKFMNYIDNCIEKKVPVEIFHPFYRNCVMLDEVMRSIIWLLENWDKYKSSFLNICGPELISRLRIVDEINRFSDQRIKYKVVYPEEDFFKIRPEITEMSSLYIGDIIEEINDPFSLRLKRELKKNDF